MTEEELQARAIVTKGGGWAAESFGRFARGEDVFGGKTPALQGSWDPYPGYRGAGEESSLSEYYNVYGSPTGTKEERQRYWAREMLSDERTRVGAFEHLEDVERLTMAGEFLIMSLLYWLAGMWVGAYIAALGGEGAAVASTTIRARARLAALQAELEGKVAVQTSQPVGLVRKVIAKIGGWAAIWKKAAAGARLGRKMAKARELGGAVRPFAGPRTGGMLRGGARAAGKLAKKAAIGAGYEAGAYGYGRMRGDAITGPETAAIAAGGVAFSPIRGFGGAVLGGLGAVGAAGLGRLGGRPVPAPAPASTSTSTPGPGASRRGVSIESYTDDGNESVVVFRTRHLTADTVYGAHTDEDRFLMGGMGDANWG
jgi:hypothetical protein